MKAFGVSLFGHRRIDDKNIEEMLTRIIKELLASRQYIIFFLGRNGEFDELAARVIKRMQREYEDNNFEMVLVLPYKVKNIEYYANYYESVVIPDCVYGVHPKSAINIRNRWMIDNTDLIIAYVEHNNGGAYDALKYAKINKKYIIELQNNKTIG